MKRRQDEEIVGMVKSIPCRRRASRLPCLKMVDHRKSSPAMSIDCRWMAPDVSPAPPPHRRASPFSLGSTCGPWAAVWPACRGGRPGCKSPEMGEWQEGMKRLLGGIGEQKYCGRNGTVVAGNSVWR